MFALANLKIMGISALVGAVLLMYPAVKLHNWRVDNLETAWAEKRKKAVKAATEEANKICDTNNQVTRKEAYALQANLDSITTQYERLRRAKPIVATCLPLARNPSGNVGTNAEAAATNGMGVSTEWLDRALYDATYDIATGMSCQRFVAEIYRLNDKADMLPNHP